MFKHKRPLTPFNLALLLLPLMAACATPMQDVGGVVVAPKVQLPPPPAIVQTVEPKPPGYFQQSLLDYFNGSKEKRTK